MAANERSLDSTASADNVWRIWSDPSTWPRWNPDIQSVNVDRGITAGSSGTMTTKSGGKHQVSIEAVQPGRSFDLVSDGLPMTKLVFHCEVTPTPTGCRVSQAVSMRGPLGPVFSGMAGKRIAETFPALLQGLKSAAEGSAVR
jgi:uncharacterized protein YndB with AHSA1/START domain